MKATTVARIKLLTISSNQWLKESKTTIKNKQKHHSSMVLIKVLVFFNIINFMSSKSAYFHEELDTYKGRTLTFVYRICFCTNKQTNPLLYIHGTKTVLFQLNPSVYILFSVIQFYERNQSYQITRFKIWLPWFYSENQIASFILQDRKIQISLPVKNSKYSKLGKKILKLHLVKSSGKI